MEAVSVRKLSKKYGDFQALSEVDLEVEEGELFALLGPNGAGKTTLMRVLTTQLDPTSGSASVLGNDVVSGGARIRELVGYIPQEMSIWTDISGYENLLIYSKIYGIPQSTRKKAISDALELMDLLEFSNHLAGTYSGGMIRKLELACAIMIKPKLMFLDEPTIGLDPSTRKAVWDKLLILNKEGGMGVFFTTHYMDEAGNYANKIGIINRGRIVKVASPDALKDSVGEGCIEIETQPALGKKALEELRGSDGVAGIEVMGNKIRLSLKDCSAPENWLLEFLLREHVVVQSITSSKPTIDDVFLKYAEVKEDEVGSRRQLAELKKTRERIRRG